MAIRPTRSDRILGRLSLIKQHGVLFLAWLPYTPGTLLASGAYLPAPGGDAGSVMSYAIHPVALSVSWRLPCLCLEGLLSVARGSSIYATVVLIFCLLSLWVNGWDWHCASFGVFRVPACAAGGPPTAISTVLYCFPWGPCLNAMGRPGSDPSQPDRTCMRQALNPQLYDADLCYPLPCCPAAAPLQEVKAVHKQSPPLGSQVATITLFNGISLPPLYFQSVSAPDPFVLPERECP